MLIKLYEGLETENSDLTDVDVLMVSKSDGVGWSAGIIVICCVREASNSCKLVFSGAW